MELKLGRERGHAMHPQLLIVPYGIETKYHIDCPYHHCKLLIVPYGIETCSGEALISISFLLIVPYGIETASATVAVNVPDAFNRTLWN